MFKSEKARSLVEGWYQQFATDPDGDLWRRLHGAENGSQDGAFFELALQVLLKRAGCRMTPHPVLPNSREQPDFLVEPPEGTPFYLEASVVTGRTDEEHRERRRLDAIADRVEAIQSEDFTIRATVDGSVQKNIRVSVLVSRVREWLDGLDEDAVRTQLLTPPRKSNKLRLKKPGEILEPEDDTPPPPMPPEARSSLVIHLEPDGDLVVTVRPRRDPPPERGISLHLWMSRLRIEHESGVVRKVSKKARKYAEVDRPLVLAVKYNEPSILGLYSTKADLLGRTEYDYDENDNLEREVGFVPGVFRPDANRRISGILLCADLRPDWLSRSLIGYVPNPWARQPLTTFPIPCDVPETDIHNRGVPLEPLLRDADPEGSSP